MHVTGFSAALTQNWRTHTTKRIIALKIFFFNHVPIMEQNVSMYIERITAPLSSYSLIAGFIPPKFLTILAGNPQKDFCLTSGVYHLG